MLRIFRGLPPLALRAPAALTIGNFDGVHRGHQAMLAHVDEAARANGLTPTVMTFEPHPREYFAELAHRPELAPTRISGLRDKLDALARHGVRQVLLQKFDATLADLRPNAFIEQFLAGLQTKYLLVGEDFRFGHKRAGDVQTLRDAGRRLGFSVETLPDVTDQHGHRVSSSEVRTALAVGDLPHAAHLLGRPYAMGGHVIHGQKLGRTLGYPTLNIRVAPRCAARSGIYVAVVHGAIDRPLPAVASLGVRPSVEDNGRVLLEPHLLDLAAPIDAYGKLVRVQLLHYVRDEEKFPDLATLTAAIAHDAQQARAYFAVHGL